MNGPATWDGVAVAPGEGFWLEDVQTEVLIWHGEQDRNDPIEMARVQERRLPHVSAVYYLADGHLIFFSRMQVGRVGKSPLSWLSPFCCSRRCHYLLPAGTV